MGAPQKGLVTVLAAVTLIAGGWRFGVRHDVDGVDGPLVVGRAVMGFPAESDDVSMGLHPCVESGGPITVQQVTGRLLAGDAQIIGVGTRVYSSADLAVGASQGYPPHDEELADVEWVPFDGSFEIDHACGSGAGNAQEIVIGVRFGPDGGAILPVVAYSTGWVRYEATRGGVVAARCGAALEGLAEYAGLCEG